MIPTRKRKKEKPILPRKRVVSRKLADLMKVSPFEGASVNKFRNWLEREFEEMTGKKIDFKVRISQNPADFEGGLANFNPNRAYPTGAGEQIPKRVGPDGEQLEHTIGIIRPERKGPLTALDILHHETAEALVSELMARDYVYGNSYAHAPFKEGLAISFHLEIYAGNKHKMTQLLKRYESLHSKASEDDQHTLGIRLAKGIYALAPNSPKDRRLIRERISERAFYRNSNIYDTLEFLGNKQQALKEVREFAKASA